MPHWLLSTTLSLGLLVAASGARAGCVFPGPADIAMPDGATATEAQMIDTQRQVKAYVAEMEAYLACLDDEANTLKASGEVTDEQLVINDKRYNSAVELMQGVAERFNVQVRIYRDNNS